MDMTASKKCTDRYGVEIEAGDLVISGGVVGIVYQINAHNAPSIKVRSTRKLYAHELGAPPVPRVGKRAKVDEQGRYVRSSSWGYEYEDYTYMADDITEVGETDYIYSIIRKCTYDVTVLRKKSGVMPTRFIEEIERHKKMYPDADEA